MIREGMRKVRPSAERTYIPFPQCETDQVANRLHADREANRNLPGSVTCAQVTSTR